MQPLQKTMEPLYEDYATVARRLCNCCTKTMQLLHEDYAAVVRRLSNRCRRPCSRCTKTMQLLQEDYATLARRLSNRCARLLTQRRQNKRFASVGSGYPFLGRSVIVSLAELNLTSSYISTVPNRSRL